MRIKSSETTVLIKGVTITITLRSASSRFGTLWQASNNYGEPKQTVKGFLTRRAALQNEIAELESLLS